MKEAAANNDDNKYQTLQYELKTIKLQKTASKREKCKELFPALNASNTEEERLAEILNAIKSGDLENIKVLLSTPIDLNRTTKHLNPLFKAIEADQIKIASYLIKQGASFDTIVDDYPLNEHIVRIFRSPEMLILLIAKGANLIYRAKENEPDTLREFLKQLRADLSLGDRCCCGDYYSMSKKTTT